MRIIGKCCLPIEEAYIFSFVPVFFNNNTVICRPFICKKYVQSSLQILSIPSANICLEFIVDLALIYGAGDIWVTKCLILLLS